MFAFDVFVCVCVCTIVCVCFSPEEFEKDKGSVPKTSRLEREIEEEMEKDTEREGGEEEEEEDEELAGLLGLSSLDISVLQELLIRHMNSKTTLSSGSTLFWRVYTLAWGLIDFRLLIFPPLSPYLCLYISVSLFHSFNLSFVPYFCFPHSLNLHPTLSRSFTNLLSLHPSLPAWPAVSLSERL